MRTGLLIIVGLSMLFIGCGGAKSSKNLSQASEQPVAPSREAATVIAKDEALEDKVAIDRLNVFVVDESDQWRVQFQPDMYIQGGGVEYVINKQTGKILEKKFSQ